MSKFFAIIRILFVAIVLSLGAFAMVSCGTGEEVDTPSAPELSVSGSVLHWNITDGATGYRVWIDGELSATVTGVRYSLDNLAVGTHSIQVSVLMGEKESEKSNMVSFTVTEAEEKSKLMYTEATEPVYTYTGLFQKVTTTVFERQIMDRQLWADFVNQFRVRIDENGNKIYADEDGSGGWRGEFWGKVMMGAIELYDQTKNEELYAILEETVRDILTTQDEDGRIASYGRLSEDPTCLEFAGWDVWCRKHVFLGMQYFYNICRDEALKAELIRSMLAQLDYIMQYVGDGDGKMAITDTSTKFGGLPSSTILIPVIRLYEMTGEQRVMDFATHIVNCGGSNIRNQIDCAIENTSLPYTWGANKGYELTNFFEGVLHYYLLTGITKYRIAAVNYAYDLLESEIVITGGAGYNSEEFNHSVVEQANPTNVTVNLETCVTTAVLDFFYNIYKVTGDTVFMDTIERMLYNQVIGYMDFDGCYEHAFTSYFNLMFATRPTSAAGGMHMVERDYGCCIAFGAKGVGIFHKLQYMNAKDALTVNLYLAGTCSMLTPGGNRVSFTTETNYPYANTIKMTVETEAEEQFALKLRIPAWSESTTVSVNGKAISVDAGGYATLMRTWKSGDEILLNLDMNPRLYWGSAECANEHAKENVAVEWGPLVLARDARLGEDIYQTVHIKTDESGRVVLTPSMTADFDTIAEFAVELTDGSLIHMVDYGSAGKTYDETSQYTVFMPTTDYWKVDLSRELVLVCSEDTIVLTGDNDQLGTGRFLSSYSEADLRTQAIVFDDRGDGNYSFRPASSDSNKAYTVGAGNKIYLRDYTGSDTQLFRLKRTGIYNFKIASVATGLLISETGDGENVHLYTDVGSGRQKWSVVLL